MSSSLADELEGVTPDTADLLILRGLTLAATITITKDGAPVPLVIDGDAGIYLDLWHGKCREAEYLIDPDSKDAEFKISAPMAKWQNVLAGKLDPVQGLITRQLKLDGNLVKIMKSVKAAQELVRCATTIDTEYA